MKRIHFVIFSMLLTFHFSHAQKTVGTRLMLIYADKKPVRFTEITLKSSVGDVVQVKTDSKDSAFPELKVGQKYDIYCGDIIYKDLPPVGAAGLIAGVVIDKELAIDLPINVQDYYGEYITQETIYCTNTKTNKTTTHTTDQLGQFWVKVHKGVEYTFQSNYGEQLSSYTVSTSAIGSSIYIAHLLSIKTPENRSRLNKEEEKRIAEQNRQDSITLLTNHKAKIFISSLNKNVQSYRFKVYLGKNTDTFIGEINNVRDEEIEQMKIRGELCSGYNADVGILTVNLKPGTYDILLVNFQGDYRVIKQIVVKPDKYSSIQDKYSKCKILI